MQVVWEGDLRGSSRGVRGAAPFGKCGGAGGTAPEKSKFVVCIRFSVSGKLRITDTTTVCVAFVIIAKHFHECTRDKPRPDRALDMGALHVRPYIWAPYIGPYIKGPHI